MYLAQGRHQISVLIIQCKVLHYRVSQIFSGKAEWSKVSFLKDRLQNLNIQGEKECLLNHLNNLGVRQFSLQKFVFIITSSRKYNALYGFKSNLQRWCNWSSLITSISPVLVSSISDAQLSNHLNLASPCLSSFISQYSSTSICFRKKGFTVFIYIYSNLDA